MFLPHFSFRSASSIREASESSHPDHSSSSQFVFSVRSVLLSRDVPERTLVREIEPAK